jgi:ABC-type phosphate transport system permease subunit
MKKINIITIYKPPRMLILSVLSILEKMLIDILLNCPTIIIGGFNVNILKTLKSTMLENFTNKYKFQLTFSRCITI